MPAAAFFYVLHIALYYYYYYPIIIINKVCQLLTIVYMLYYWVSNPLIVTFDFQYHCNCNPFAYEQSSNLFNIKDFFPIVYYSFIHSLIYKAWQIIHTNNMDTIQYMLSAIDFFKMRNSLFFHRIVKINFYPNY
jgi:hypothetical protein